jgi:hypothetical protein
MNYTSVLTLHKSHRAYSSDRQSPEIAWRARKTGRDAQTARAAARAADLAPVFKELREAGTTSLERIARAADGTPYPNGARWQRVDPYAGRADHGALACITEFTAC